MPGSIGNELYSEILQSAELDRGTTAAPSNSNLNETDPDVLWYDDGSSCEDSVEGSNKSSDMDREWQKRRNQFHTIGYRDGLIAGKETAAQEGFNIGFKDSVFIGFNWGFVRGITSAMACLPAGLKEKLVETEETRTKFRQLHESVQAVPTTDALRMFYEDQKMTKAAQRENAESSSTITELNHHIPEDFNVLQNYSTQLQSLLGEAPLVKGSLRIN